MIRLQDFINVNITRDTVISTGRNKTVAYISSNVQPDENKPDGLIYTSITEILAAAEVDNPTNLLYTTDSDVYKACEVFFNNGGRSIMLVNAPVDLNDSSRSLGIYRDTINALPLEVVAFAVQQGTVSTVGEITTYNGGLLDSDRAGLISYLDDIEENEGTAYRKLLALNILDVSLVDSSDTAPENALAESTNVIYKYTNSYDYSALAVLAHLSKIDLNNPNSISDYCFTEEATLTPVTNSAALNWNDLGHKLNMTLDIFKGVPTNFGGNTGGGTDLVEEYMTIFIAQDVLLAEVDLLKSKLRTNNAITKVNSALIRILETYYDAGFLVQEVYTGEDITAIKNGVNYTLLSKNSMITGGYIISILPMSSRSTAEIASKQLPDVHIIFNTSKGIRYIKNVGNIL